MMVMGTAMVLCCCCGEGGGGERGVEQRRGRMGVWFCVFIALGVVVSSFSLLCVMMKCMGVCELLW